MTKRCVFRRRLKVLSVSDAVTQDGKVFQTCGAATKSAISNRRRTRRWRDKGRRWRRSQPFSRVRVRRHRRTSRKSLNSIRSGTRSRWRSRSSGVKCSYFRADQTSRAAAFITDYSLSSWLPGRPASVCQILLSRLLMLPSFQVLSGNSINSLRAPHCFDMNYCRRASRCHSPGATTPARRPATVLPLVTSTDECCATGVMWRSSWTRSHWTRGSAWVDVNS